MVGVVDLDTWWDKSVVAAESAVTADAAVAISRPAVAETEKRRGAYADTQTER